MNLSVKKLVLFVHFSFLVHNLSAIYSLEHFRNVICLLFVSQLQFLHNFPPQGTLGNGNYSPYSNGHTYTASRPQSPQVTTQTLSCLN